MGSFFKNLFLGGIVSASWAAAIRSSGTLGEADSLCTSLVSLKIRTVVPIL